MTAVQLWSGRWCRATEHSFGCPGQGLPHAQLCVQGRHCEHLLWWQDREGFDSIRYGAERQQSQSDQFRQHRWAQRVVGGIVWQAGMARQLMSTAQAFFGVTWVLVLSCRSLWLWGSGSRNWCFRVQISVMNGVEHLVARQQSALNISVSK